MQTPLVDQKILACPKCGTPDGKCEHATAIVMTKGRAANLAVIDAFKRLHFAE